MQCPYRLFKYDIPEEDCQNLLKADNIALDTETTGLNIGRDRLCLVQIKASNLENAYLVHYPDNNYNSPNLVKVLQSDVKKVFHFGRFDIAVLYHTFNVLCHNVFCTKIASYIARTYSSKHSLKELCRLYLDTSINKAQQGSYWGNDTLDHSQIIYAINDVLYLDPIMKCLLENIRRESRLHILKPNLDYLPYRAMMDVEGWSEMNFMEFYRAEKG